jgi:hypothetical protein
MNWKLGKIYIAEFRGLIHEVFCEEFKEALTIATDTYQAYLKCHGSSYINILPPIEPDAGFGCDTRTWRVSVQLVSRGLNIIR